MIKAVILKFSVDSKGVARVHDAKLYPVVFDQTSPHRAYWSFHNDIRRKNIWFEEDDIALVVDVFPTFSVVDGVMAITTTEAIDIGTGFASEAIVTGSTDQDIVAVAAAQVVITRTANKGVSTFTTTKNIGSIATI